MSGFVDIIEVKKYDYITEIRKYNHSHDPRTGRFTTGSGVDSGVGQGSGKTSIAPDGRTEFQYGYNGGGLSGTLRDVEAANRSVSYEVATIINRDGDVLFQKGGSNTHVSFNRSEQMEMRGGVLTHNHPADVILSPGDMRMSLFLAEIRATTPSGKVYSVSGAKDRMFPSDYSDYYIKVRSDALDKLGYVEVGGPSDSSLPAEIRKKSFAYISEECGKWLADNAGKYGIKYKEEQIMEKSVKSTVFVEKQDSLAFEDDKSFFLDLPIGHPLYEENQNRIQDFVCDVSGDT